MPHDSFLKLPLGRRDAIVQSGIEEFSRHSYADASTDAITKSAGISKGLLFRYFGSKRAFYLYCLESALARLNEPAAQTTPADFYGVLFASMEAKLRLCKQYPDEMHLSNMAAREMSAEVRDAKNAVIAQAYVRAKSESDATIGRAIATLPLKNGDPAKAKQALSLYVGALVRRVLEEYIETPDAFFENADAIAANMKEMIDLLLYGIAQKPTEGGAAL